MIWHLFSKEFATWFYLGIIEPIQFTFHAAFVLEQLSMERSLDISMLLSHFRVGFELSNMAAHRCLLSY